MTSGELTSTIGAEKTKNERFLGLSRLGWHRAKWFYVFVAPWVLGFTFFTLAPMIFGILISFTNFSGSNFDTVRLVGLNNYTEAIGEFFTSDGLAKQAFARTISFASVTIPINIAIALLIAILLTLPIRGRALFRTIFYIPSVIPIVASAWVWKSIMDNNYGVFNSLISKVIPDTYIRWMTEFPFEVLVMWSVWAGVGSAIIIFMAGIKGVPNELMEAARIDGANSFQVFLNITLPLLTPLVFYQLIVGLIGSLQILTQPLLLAPKLLATETGAAGIATIPPRETYMFLIHIYQESFLRMRYGYGAALLWLLFLFILVLTFFVNYTTKYWVYYEVDPESQQ